MNGPVSSAPSIEGHPAQLLLGAALTSDSKHETMIIGPGAIGCLLAARLGIGGRAVVLVDHDPARAAALQSLGLTLEEEDGAVVRARVAVTTLAEVGEATGVILLCVKSTAVHGVLAQLQPRLSAAATVVFLQNGVGHLEAVAELVPPACPVVGVTAVGAHLRGVGQVVAAGSGPTRIGVYPPGAHCERSRVAAVAGLLQEAGLAAETVGDIRGPVWDKLMVNVGINALTAIFDCANGALLDNPWARDTMAAAVAEAETVARVLRIPIAPDPLARVLAVCRATSANISSMLQDVRRRRLTEIGAINGAVVRLGRRLGIPVPVNTLLVERVTALERAFAPL